MSTNNDSAKPYTARDLKEFASNHNNYIVNRGRGSIAQEHAERLKATPHEVLAEMQRSKQ